MKKVWLITGCSTGFGRALAKEVLAKGYSAAVAARNTDDVKDIVEGYPETALAVRLDVTVGADIKAVVETTVKHFGQIDVLVNNAGIFDYYTNSLDTSEDLWDKIFAINVKSMFQLSNLVLPHMQAQKQGAIINICSIAGLVANMGGAAYTASKHAVAGYTKHLAAVYGKDGIKINAICPGTIRTAMTAEMLKTRPTDKIPLDRFGEVGEVVDLAVFLASDEARFMNGALVPIDGGFTIV